MFGVAEQSEPRFTKKYLLLLSNQQKRLPVVCEKTTFFIYVYTTDLDYHLSISVHTACTGRARHGLTDSIYASVSQLIDGSLLVDAVRVLHFYNSTHLRGKDRVLTLHRKVLQTTRLSRPTGQPRSSPPSSQTYL